ncbi:MAG: aldo/keto reductase [Candidatus Poribacteria bacterium]|nr:aldo/keto reductase [Candidatus Poribacteria bacterium]
MQYTTLGKTGLQVGVAGLGCGGFSQLGQATGKSEAQSIALVQQAIDLGVNFVDTARNYRTEAIVGKALKGRNRDELVISTKTTVANGTARKPPAQVVRELEASLQAMDLTSVEVFHLHGVPPGVYDYAVREVVPVLLREREKGKFHFLGITEVPPKDAHHQTLQRAVREDCFDVVMPAFHLMHQSAREKIFKHTLAKEIGVLNMFAVRLLFSQPGRLNRVVKQLADEGKLPVWLAETDNPLGFLIHPGGAHTVIDAAYRYCRHEPGTNVILFGTSSSAHMRSNIDSILSGTLPEADLRRIDDLFGALVDVGLDAPGQPSSR